MNKQIATIFFLALTVALAAVRPLSAQPAPKTATDSNVAKASKAPPTVFRDSDGNLISNNEFVDIRMANFHLKDQTPVRTLDDGTVEFRLQKIPQEGAPAPFFKGKTVDGMAFAFEALLGKVVVLNFWFIGCAACRAETPKLNSFAAKFSGHEDIKFIALTADPTGNVRKYLRSNRFDYTMIADAQDALDMFVFSGYPKNIVIGRDGRIVYWRSSINAWDKFESVVRAEAEKK